MTFINDNEISPPPGIVSTIKSGFDITSKQIGIILFPLLLDIFLWLGPHLSISNLLYSAQTQLEMLVSKPLIGATDIKIYQEMLTELIAQDINIFSLLRTFPIGISSIMHQIPASASPLGDVISYQIGSDWEFLLWFGMLTIIGWILGSIYFAYVAKVSVTKVSVANIAVANIAVANTAVENDGQDFRWLIKTILQASALSVVLIIALIAFGLPLFLFFAVFMQINATLAQIVFLLLVFFAMWLIVPIFFSAHGIFIKEENFFRSILSSIHLSRFTLPTCSFFIISIIVLAQGFNILWLTPSSSTWMMLVGILGHAFITTALLSASFIYYYDMNVWLETVLEKLDSQKASTQTQ